MSLVDKVLELFELSGSRLPGNYSISVHLHGHNTEAKAVLCMAFDSKSSLSPFKDDMQRFFTNLIKSSF